MDDCSPPIDPVSRGPKCFNNGTCVDQVGGYSCTCPPGFVGERCEGDVNECLSNPCDIRGTQNCVQRVNDFYCECRAGHTGGCWGRVGQGLRAQRSLPAARCSSVRDAGVRASQEVLYPADQTTQVSVPVGSSWGDGDGGPFWHSVSCVLRTRAVQGAGRAHRPPDWPTSTAGSGRSTRRLRSWCPSRRAQTARTAGAA